MAYRPRFCVGQFNGARLRDPQAKQVDRRLSDRAMYHLLEALISINMDYIAENPGVPSIYLAVSPVTRQALYYKRVILPGQEDDDWADVPTVLTLGYFDCEDGVAYQVAWLRRHGEYAMPHIVYQEDGRGNWLYHVQLKRANGVIEDPSKRLDRMGYYRKVFSR